MYLNKAIIICLAIFLLIVVLFRSCYHQETENTQDYYAFRQEMQDKSKTIYDMLPALNDEDCIEDMYLFYSDWDFIDSFYTVYLNCQYSEQEYKNEEMRIAALFSDEQVLVKNSDLFDYPSLMHRDYFDFDLNGMIGMMTYEYVLFDESEFRVVYVTLFDKELNGKSTNIPEEYLPKELNELRRSAANRCW